MQASDASIAMLIAAEWTLRAVSILAEGQACARLVDRSGEFTCDSVSKLAKNSIRTAWPESPVAAGESAIGSVLHECRWKNTSDVCSG